MSIQCDCSWDGSDGEPIVCFTSKRVRARREHVCIECRETIDVGSFYFRESGLCDGSWFRDATCLPCKAIANHYCPGGYPGGCLAEQIEECIGWDYREAPPDEHDPFYDGNVPVRRVE